MNSPNFKKQKTSYWPVEITEQQSETGSVWIKCTYLNFTEFDANKMHKHIPESVL